MEEQGVDGHLVFCSLVSLFRRREACYTFFARLVELVQHVEEECMVKSYKFLRVSAKVFKVLAWVALAIQVVTGLILIIGGGEPVVIQGINVPARAVGVLSFVAGGMYFFSLWLMSGLIQLLLDIREHQSGGQSAFGGPSSS